MGTGRLAPCLATGSAAMDPTATRAHASCPARTESSLQAMEQCTWRTASRIGFATCCQMPGDGDALVRLSGNAQALNRGVDGALHVFHFAFGLVRIARPEKTLQAVPLAPRHDVDMQMRHTLAHPIVDRDEGSLGLH